MTIFPVSGSLKATFVTVELLPLFVSIRTYPGFTYLVNWDMIYTSGVAQYLWGLFASCTNNVGSGVPTQWWVPTLLSNIVTQLL